MNTFIILVALTTIGVWELTKSWAILITFWFSMGILLSMITMINWLFLPAVR